jgi:hypothetical protein
LGCGSIYSAAVCEEIEKKRKQIEENVDARHISIKVYRG